MRTSETNSFDPWIVAYVCIPVLVVWLSILACIRCKPPGFPILTRAQHLRLSGRSFNV